MLTIRSICNIQTNIMSKALISHSRRNQHSYEAAIDALNGLQSNAQYLKNIRGSNNAATEYANTILKVQKYLIRSGISLKTLEKLSVIHIAGTKGKGSTCAYCESILRHHGFRTGFYSSPHLLEVRERIRINGKPLSKDLFASYFWEVYDKLQNNKENSTDMPAYFRFLTILAFHIFLVQKVDVAVIEVGIGGEYDCTNIVRNVPVVGITSLDLDHVGLLGNTIEKIAWHKSGIMKPYCRAFTVPQLENALKVIEERSKEKECFLEVLNNGHIAQVNKLMEFPNDAIAMNAALSIELCQAWGLHAGYSSPNFKTSPQTKEALQNCFWPGRFQILHSNNITYYIDGAHTFESLKLCVTWFLLKSKESRNKKILIFNATGDRDSTNLLSVLHCCNFNKVIFVPNIARHDGAQDNVNYNNPENEQLSRSYKHKTIWVDLNKKNNGDFNEDCVKVYSCVYDAIKSLQPEENYDILVTGSLHLVGSVLSLINPELSDHSRSVQFKTYQNV